MPNFDRTGPNREGPRTGRGRGNCSNESPRNNCMRRRCLRNMDENFPQNRMRRNNQNPNQD